MPVDVALDVGNTALVAQYLRPSTLGIFAAHRPGCATTFDIVNARFPSQFKIVLDMVIAGVAENNTFQVQQVAEYVQSQLLRQQQLLNAAQSKLCGSGGSDGNGILESKGWLHQLDGRLAHVMPFLTGYVERLVTCCSFPIMDVTVAKMNDMLISPTVVHVRAILMRLLTELDTAASLRTITMLHKKAQRAHEAVRNTTRTHARTHVCTLLYITET